MTKNSFVAEVTFKEKSPMKVLLMNFARYLKHLFYRPTLGDSFCSTEKYFTPSEKRRKMETAGKKSNSTCRKVLKHYLLQVFISSYYSKKVLFLFSLHTFTFHWKHVFLETMHSIESLSHCVKSIQIRSFFWSIFSHIRTEYEQIRSISPYSVRIWENTDQKKLRI